MTGLPLLETTIRDFRYAWRMLRKTPVFTAAAVLTLALGIAANTAVFSVVDALLFTPPPYPRPDRIGLLERRIRVPGVGENRSIGADGRMWFALRDNTSTMDAAATGGAAGVNLVAGDRARYVQQQRVSADYFKVMNIPPLIGREFTRDEDLPGGPALVVLSHAIWARLFDSDPSIVGRTIRLRGEPHTVVGVLPANFPVTQRTSITGGRDVDVWTPLRASTSGAGSGINYTAIVRLKDGVTWSDAERDVVGASSQAFQSVPSGTVAQLSVVPMQAATAAAVRGPLLMLWGAVAIVLLIACINLAGLLLSRGAARKRELATRMALGSGRATIVRQLMVESVVLAFLGAALGIVIAWAVLETIGTLGADVFDMWQTFTMNARVLGVTLATALATSVIFGLAPAWHVSNLDLRGGLAGRGTHGSSARWPRQALVIGEVALGVVLVVAAGLLVRTFVHLRELPSGFDEFNLVTESVSLQEKRYETPVVVEHLFQQTLERIRAIPGVDGAGVALGMPYTRLLNFPMRRVDGPQIDAPREGRITNVSYVTPGYFETLRVPLLRGRLISELDAASAPAIALVNDAFVVRYFRGDAPVGRHVALGDQVREIVGIVGNVQQSGAGWGNFGPIAPVPCIYIPVSQTTGAFLALVHTWFEPSWAVRSTVSTVVPRIRDAIESVDPQLSIARVQRIDDLRGERLVSHRFMTSLVSALAVIALVLSATGLYGLVAGTVTERTRELGIRLALGAAASQAMRVVITPGIVLAGIGLVIGVAGAFGAARLLQSFLWGVTPSDPATFVAVAATVFVVAVAASLVPALRILRLDPALTLRAE